jgi:hypothetical protein
MHPSPSFLVALVVILSLSLVVAMTALGVVWSHGRGLPVRIARLVDDLAQRQREMEGLLARIEASDPGRAHPRVEWAPRAAPGPPGWASPDRRVDPVGPNAPDGPTLIAVPNLAAPPTPATAATSATLGRRFGPIWDLFDAGVTPGEIARRTDQPIGQVELILALRRQLTPAMPAGRA